jgi:hypothetical protein
MPAAGKFAHDVAHKSLGVAEEHRGPGWRIRGKLCDPGNPSSFTRR